MANMASCGYRQTVSQGAPERFFKIFQPRGVSSLQITCESDSAGKLDVFIPGLADKGDWAVIDPGESKIFRVFDGGIHEAWAQGRDGLSTFSWHPVAAT